MKPVLIVYATREGQTRRVAEAVAESVRARGLEPMVMNAAEAPPAFALDEYSPVIVAASVHSGRHEKEVVAFVKQHLTELERVPTLFISVSLSEASAENSAATAERRAKASTDVKMMIDRFVAETGWHPSKMAPVAGALAYSKYNFLLRWVMKRAAKASGGSVDTTRDHEYTDWVALDRAVEEIVPKAPAA